MNKKSYSILIVDDSEDDRFIIRRVIQHFPRFQIVSELADGEAAIEYLGRQREVADGSRQMITDLMLLDLKMPRKTGFEVLKWLRDHPFPLLTVVVLSGSNLPVDIGASLALGAHGYWTKTADLLKQKHIAAEIEGLLDKRSGERNVKRIEPPRSNTGSSDQLQNAG